MVSCGNDEHLVHLFTHKHTLTLLIKDLNKTTKTTTTIRLSLSFKSVFLFNTNHHSLFKFFLPGSCQVCVYVNKLNVFI